MEQLNCQLDPEIYLNFQLSEMFEEFADNMLSSEESFYDASYRDIIEQFKVIGGYYND